MPNDVCKKAERTEKHSMINVEALSLISKHFSRHLISRGQKLFKMLLFTLAKLMNNHSRARAGKSLLTFDARGSIVTI